MHLISRSWTWLKDQTPYGARRRIAKQAETFFTEAAVLLFVFPLLDELLHHEGVRGVNWPIILSGLLLALILYVVGLIIAAFTEEDGNG